MNVVASVVVSMLAALCLSGCSWDVGDNLIKPSPIDDVVRTWGYTGESQLADFLRDRLVEIARTAGASGLQEAFRNANARCQLVGQHTKCELDRFRTLKALGPIYFRHERTSWHITVFYVEGDKLPFSIGVVATQSVAEIH